MASIDMSIGNEEFLPWYRAAAPHAEVECEGVQTLGRFKPDKPVTVKATKGGQRLHFKLKLVDGTVDGFDLDDQQDAYGDPRNGILLEDNTPAHADPGFYTSRRFVWHGIQMMQTVNGVPQGHSIGFSTNAGPGGVFELTRAYLHDLGHHTNMQHAMYLQDLGFKGQDIVYARAADRAVQNRGDIGAAIDRFIHGLCGCGSMFGDAEGVPGGASNNLMTNGLAFPALTPGRYAIESYQDGTGNVWQGYLAPGAKIQPDLAGVDVSHAVALTEDPLFDWTTLRFDPRSVMLKKPGQVPLWTIPTGVITPPPHGLLDPRITQAADGNLTLRWTADPNAGGYVIDTPSKAGVIAGKSRVESSLGRHASITVSIAPLYAQTKETVSYP